MAKQRTFSVKTYRHNSKINFSGNRNFSTYNNKYNSKINKNNNNYINAYLAGLFEGGGHIWFSKENMQKKT